MCRPPSRTLIRLFEDAIDATFSKREAEVIGTLARAQVEADKLAERIAVVRQVRGSLINQLGVELRRKLSQHP